MIGYYKTTLVKAGAMLHALKANKENLGRLLDLQVLLIRQIKQCERNIRRLKLSSKELKASLGRDRLPKDRAQEAKRKIEATSARVSEYNHLIFIWKGFGDGIAHIYLDKYALKHTFYSVDDYSPKETAGFITGKVGFRLEWKIVKKVIGAGRPILLCDITNVIRHGDVCVLLGPDPFPLEVKSSKNRNARVDRQLQHLQLLYNFYAEDGADEFRGVSNVHRQVQVNTEVNHIEALNGCIASSYREGMSCISPEPGIHYVCIHDDLNLDKLEGLLNNSSMLFMLNETKANGMWIPYYPFTLSIHPEHLYNFIRGSIYLLVIVDMRVLKALFKEKGVFATILSDGNYIIQICKNRKNFDEGVFRISHNLFQRIPHEFQSLGWFANEQSLVFEKSELDSAYLEKGCYYEIPDSWHSVQDIFDDN